MQQPGQRPGEWPEAEPERTENRLAGGFSHPQATDASMLETVATSSAAPFASNVNSREMAFLERRYEILAQAGRGAMGQVFKARDRETREIVALKILKPEIASDPAMVERFKSELLYAQNNAQECLPRVRI